MAVILRNDLEKSTRGRESRHFIALSLFDVETRGVKWKKLLSQAPEYSFFYLLGSVSLW